jgi:hypothetical protein
VDIRLGRRRRLAAILDAPIGEMSFHFMASARLAVVQNFLALALPGNSFSGILRPASHNLLQSRRLFAAAEQESGDRPDAWRQR